MNEFVAALENATGMERWDIEHVKGEERIELGRELMAQGQMWQGVAKWQRMERGMALPRMRSLPMTSGPAGAGAR